MRKKQPPLAAEKVSVERKLNGVYIVRGGVVVTPFNISLEGAAITLGLSTEKSTGMIGEAPFRLAAAKPPRTSPEAEQRPTDFGRAGGAQAA
jgi:hypothetical protein